MEPLIISTESNPVVVERSRKLKIECFNNCLDKATLLKEILDDRGLEVADAGFVGNDINDLQCLNMVGLPIVVNDAHLEVLGSAVFRTAKAGGHGAVREVCDMIFSVRQSAGSHQ